MLNPDLARYLGVALNSALGGSLVTLACRRRPGRDARSDRAATARQSQAESIRVLAMAIETHAAAIDNHGAATVAAAVENNAGAIAHYIAAPVSTKN